MGEDEDKKLKDFYRNGTFLDETTGSLPDLSDGLCALPIEKESMMILKKCTCKENDGCTDECDKGDDILGGCYL